VNFHFFLVYLNFAEIGPVISLIVYSSEVNDYRSGSTFVKRHSHHGRLREEMRNQRIINECENISTEQRNLRYRRE
jgi:hypothetical protein